MFRNYRSGSSGAKNKGTSFRYYSTAAASRSIVCPPDTYIETYLSLSKMLVAIRIFMWYVVLLRAIASQTK